jgi:hypothetical protein
MFCSTGSGFGGCNNEGEAKMLWRAAARHCRTIQFVRSGTKCKQGVAAFLAAFATNSVFAAPPDPPPLGELSASITTPVGFCKAVLDQGLFDTNSLEFNASNYGMNRKTICQSEYANYAMARNLAASGGINIIDILGVTGNDNEASSRYRTKCNQYCGASFGEVKNNSALSNIAQHVSAAIFGSFNHCLDILSKRSVRYIVPTPQGSGFTIFIETLTSGVHDIHIRGIDMLDNDSGDLLKIENCVHDGKPLSAQTLPLSSGGSNKLSVLCLKPKDHSVSVKVTSDAGDVATVEVPASPPAPPPVLDRLTAIEGRLAKAEGTYATKQDLAATKQDLANEFAGLNTAISQIGQAIAIAEPKHRQPPRRHGHRRALMRQVLSRAEWRLARGQR